MEKQAFEIKFTKNSFLLILLALIISNYFFSSIQLSLNANMTPVSARENFWNNLSYYTLSIIVFYLLVNFRVIYRILLRKESEVY